MANTTFRDAYDVLQKHAELLRNQREPDIDNLLTIVTESVVAYKVCKERIDAVEKALAQALSNAGVESAGSRPPHEGDDWLDDPGLPRSNPTSPASEGSAGKNVPDFDDPDFPF